MAMEVDSSLSRPEVAPVGYSVCLTQFNTFCAPTFSVLCAFVCLARALTCAGLIAMVHVLWQEDVIENYLSLLCM